MGLEAAFETTEWRGSDSDYTEAKKWLGELLKVCGLDYGQLVVCAGNHDVIRTRAQKLPRPESTKDADQVLSPPIAEHFEAPFAEFTVFCKQVGIPILKFGEFQSWLVGERTLNGVRFVIFNSAWFSKNDDDKGKLWIGQPHFKYMEAHDQFAILQSQNNAPTTITLLHHPAEWLHSDEQHAAISRPNTLDCLAARCHLLLSVTEALEEIPRRRG